MNSLVLIYDTQEHAQDELIVVCKQEQIVPSNISAFYPEKNGYTIEQIRTVIDLASHHYGVKSAYVLWNFEQAKDVVQNSFLKILEEHSENIKFVLAVTSETSLLPTILSRTTVVRTKTVRNGLTPAETERITAFITAVRQKGALASTLITTSPAKKREEISTLIRLFLDYGYHALGTKTADRAWLTEKLARALEAYPLVTQNFVDSEAVLDNIFLS